MDSFFDNSECIIFSCCSPQTLLTVKMLCKTASCLFYLFSPLYSSLLSLSFSPVAGLFLLSPAMMAPHLAVGTMRNDKMGEPCFYLMGQNQTTVCSQKSVRIHYSCHNFPFDFVHPSSSSLPESHLLYVCARVCLHAFSVVTSELTIT